MGIESLNCLFIFKYLPGIILEYWFIRQISRNNYILIILSVNRSSFQIQFLNEVSLTIQTFVQADMH